MWWSFPTRRQTALSHRHGTNPSFFGTLHVPISLFERILRVPIWLQTSSLEFSIDDFISGTFSSWDRSFWSDFETNYVCQIIVSFSVEKPAHHASQVWSQWDQGDFYIAFKNGRRKTHKKKYFVLKNMKEKKWKILTSGDQVPRCRRRNGSHQLFGSKGSIFVLLLNICWCIIVCLIDWKVMLISNSIYIWLANFDW